MARTPTPDRRRVRSQRLRVVPLALYRAARHAATVLLGLLHEPPWLADVRVELQDGVPVIVVRVHCLDDGVRCCLPRHVNSIRVEPRLVLGRAS